MKKLFLLFPVLIVCFFIMSGQKSNDDPGWNNPRSSAVYPNGNYQSLPIVKSEINQFTFSPRTIITPIGVLTITPNLRVHPSSTTQQSECPIVRHPLNPNIMFGSSNSINNSNNFINSGVYVTTDGGVTWFGSDTVNAPSRLDQRGDPGPTIDKDGRFIFTHLSSALNFGSVIGMAANYSTDNGLTWSESVLVSNDPNVDKNLAGSDGSPSSPFYGNSYFAWTSFGTSPANGRFSRTTDGGVTWSAPLIINSTPAGHNAQGHDVASAPDGSVYVCWTAGVSSSPFTEDFVGVAKSTNGGVSFTATENAFDDNGSRSGAFNGWGIRTNGFPRIAIDKSGGPRNGWIYIVTDQINLGPAGSDADVILNRSTNGGVNWSTGIRVNQDALNNGKVQFFPAICVDDAGGVNIVYYDNRNFPSSGDSCSVFVSRSLDGGTTFTDIEVADHHFKPKLLPGINTMGDYIGITSGNGKLWPIWMDDKAGPGVQFNAWTTAIQIQTFPLNAFNLNTPAPGARIQTLPNNTTTYTFTWDTSASTASYKWIFGSPTTGVRKITLQPTGNHLNITGGELDNLLAGLGLAQGDSLVGQWDVWAFRNNQTNDSLKSANGPRALTLKRAKPLLVPFSLVSPPNNTTILTLPTNTTPVNITWTKSGEAVKYKWLFARPNFSSSANIKFIIGSNNSGFDSALSINNSKLDSLLAGIGVAVGDSAVGQWRVYGYSVTDSLASSQTFNLTLRRGIPPTVTTSADSIVVAIPVGGTATRNLVIGNTGQFPLNWNISESSVSLDRLQAEPLSTEIINEINNQTKGAITRYHGPDVTDGMGGPDAGGYRWIDSDEPGGPTFNWVDISTTGTAITTWTNGTGDDGSVVVPLPFTFTYYDNPYSQLKICTNGWVGFDVVSTNTAYINTAIPATPEPNNSLYVFWDDMDTRTTGTVYYKNDAANNRFIVEYKDVPHYTPPGGGPYTYEVIIYNDGRVFYQYLSVLDPVNDCTIGTENSTGTTGLQVVFSSAYLHNNLAIKIEKGLSWVDESPSSGTIAPGGNQNVNVMFNTTGLSIGSYSGVLKVNSNDPITPVKNVGIRLIVGVVGVQNNSLGIPTQFELAQNYPNPFNPTTKINFAIPKESFVTLKIYDILGKEVTRLVNENKLPGYYNVDFNASDFASGLYFYKIEAGSFSETKRMLLVK